MTTREQCIADAGVCLAEAVHLADTLPVAEAARLAYTPSGPPLAEIEMRIRARRGLTVLVAS